VCSKYRSEFFETSVDVIEVASMLTMQLSGRLGRSPGIVDVVALLIVRVGR